MQSDLPDIAPAPRTAARPLWISPDAAALIVPTPNRRLWVNPPAPGCLIRMVDGQPVKGERFELLTTPTGGTCVLVLGQSAEWKHTYRTWTTSAPGAPISAALLATIAAEPAPQVIPGLLPIGLSVIGGRPKSGKSWFTLGLALAKAQGEPWGGIVIDPAPVLFFGLEDSLDRLAQRIKLLAGDDAPENLHALTTLPPGESGLATIAELIGEYSPKLIVIDTYGKWRGGQGMSYAKDYAAANQLKAIADEHKLAIAVVHHTIKTPTKNPLDALSGGRGLPAAADAVLILARDPMSSNAALWTTGREIPQQIIPLRLHSSPERVRWIAQRPQTQLTHR